MNRSLTMKWGRPRSRVAGIAVALSAGLALAACGGSSGGSDAAGSNSITLVSQPNGAGLALYLADKLGYFTAEGLNVTIKDYASGPASLTAGAAGQWQAGWLGAPPALTGANTFGLIPLGMMIQEDANHIMYMRKSTLAGKTPAQVLASNPVGTSQNSLAEQVMRACATKLGVDPAKVKLVPLDGGQVVQALKSGKVNVVNTWSSPGYSLIDDPDYTPVCNGKEAGVAVLDPYVVTPKFVKENPEGVQKFARAVYKADDYINANHDKAVDAMVEYYKAKGITGTREQADYEVTIRQWNSLDEAISGISSGASAKGLTASADFFVKAGVYPQAPPVDKLLTQSLDILQKAKAGQAS